MAIAPTPRLFLKRECILGEGPVWDAARQCLWFVDIKQNELAKIGADGEGLAIYPAPGPIGWVLPTSNDNLLAGIGGALFRFDVDLTRFDHLLDVDGEPSSNRLNDACSDPSGRAWFGSMDDGECKDTGRFYCFEKGVVRPSGMADICITNGPAISPDGATIYFTDTLGKTIYCADLIDGEPSNLRQFATIDVPDAYPDGPVVDSEGFVWTGLWNGWGLACFAPDGRLHLRVKIPAANVTKLAFGGPDLRTAFVTTARKGLSVEEAMKQPLAGSVFAFDAPVAGAASTPVLLG